MPHISTHTLDSYSKHTQSLIALGVPIIVGQVGSIVQGLADTIMVGQYSAHSLAAAGFVNSIMNLILVAALGYSYGLTPVVGALHARGEYREAGRALKSSLVVNGKMALYVGAVMTLLYFLLSHMGQPEELLPEIRIYYLTILLSLPLQMCFNGFKQFVDGVGDTRTTMWILLSGNLLNILGNWLLIYGIGPFPEWGILGAGLATLCSRLFMLASIAFVVHHHPRFAPYHEGFYHDVRQPAQEQELHRLGMPLSMQMGMETASFSLTALMMGWLGAPQLAAHQVMCNVGAMCFLVYYGIGAATAIRVSHYKGLNRWTDVRRASLSGLWLTLGMGVIISALILIYRHSLTSVFTNDAHINRIVISMMVPFVLYQFGDALQTNFANALRGIADVHPMVRYAFISYVLISLPFSYLFAFPLGMDAAGVWMAYPIALTTAGILYSRRFFKRVNHRLQRE